MKHFQTHRRSNARRLGPENSGRPFEQLRLPSRDLVRMHIENLRQFRKRLLTFQGNQSHLRLESRCMVPARSSSLVMTSPDARQYSPLSGGKSTYRSVQFSRASSVDLGSSFTVIRQMHMVPVGTRQLV